MKYVHFALHGLALMLIVVLFNRTPESVEVTTNEVIAQPVVEPDVDEPLPLPATPSTPEPVLMEEASTAPSMTVTSEGLKIAYVDIETILAGYRKVQEANQKIEAKQKAIEQEFKDVLNKSKAKFEAYQKEVRNLTQQQQMERADELAKERETLEAKERALNDQMMAFEKSQNDQINQAIKAEVERYRKQTGLDLVLERKKFGAVMAVNTQLDITSKILNALNQ